MKGPLMYSRPSSAKATSIPSYLSPTNGASRLVSKSPTTTSAAPWGRLKMAATTSYTVEALPGAKWHPMIYHHLSPDVIWKMTMFDPWAWNASMEKCFPSGRRW